MKRTTETRTNLVYNNIGGFCSECHFFQPVGDIQVNININFSEFSSPETVRLYDMQLMNFEETKSRSVIEIYCPHCGDRMIQIDNSIGKDISLLNDMGLFTMYSCDGNNSYNTGYVKFYEFDILKSIMDFKQLTHTTYILDDETCIFFDNYPSLIFNLSARGVYEITDADIKCLNEKVVGNLEIPFPDALHQLCIDIAKDIDAFCSSSDWCYADLLFKYRSMSLREYLNLSGK